jgi:hypothetical protein
MDDHLIRVHGVEARAVLKVAPMAFDDLYIDPVPGKPGFGGLSLHRRGGDTHSLYAVGLA